MRADHGPDLSDGCVGRTRTLFLSHRDGEEQRRPAAPVEMVTPKDLDS